MTEQATLLTIENGIATLTLNRPDKHNAFDDQIIEELLAHLDVVSTHEHVRALLLKAEGKHFCAGADLAWMKRMAKLDYSENLSDARELARLMATLNDMPVPTVVQVQGAAYGGAIGLIACCDIAIASDNSRFCLSEVKLGLAPATIGPYVVDAMGARRCRQLFITAEVFSADEAARYGLIHRVVAKDELTTEVQDVISQIKQSGPKATKAAKRLIQTIQLAPSSLLDDTSKMIAELRVSEEGQEGLSAFFEKRLPSWRDNEGESNE